MGLRTAKPKTHGFPPARQNPKPTRARTSCLDLRECLPIQLRRTKAVTDFDFLEIERHSATRGLLGRAGEESRTTAPSTAQNNLKKNQVTPRLGQLDFRYLGVAVRAHT